MKNETMAPEIALDEFFSSMCVVGEVVGMAGV
jgi:hypothetical protein